MPKGELYANAEQIEGEEWRPVPGFDNRYEASSHGRLRVVLGKTACRSPRMLRAFVAANGYLRTAIMRNGKAYKPGVHLLVASAFLGPCPDGMEIDHIDGDKSNCKPSNLEYVTHAENLQRARNNGAWGEKKYEVADILALRQAGLLQREIAERLGISQGQVSVILRQNGQRSIPEHKRRAAQSAIGGAADCRSAGSRFDLTERTLLY